MDKHALRRYISEQKRALTPAQIDSASRRLTAQFLCHPLYRQASAVYGYLSFNQEVYTIPLLEQILADGKRVAVPKVESGSMVFYWMEDLTQVQPGYAGIPEPDGSQPPADDAAALVLVPGLAFDTAGNRMGYGGGFYDKFLAARSHPTIALCYDFQLLSTLEPQPHDIPVDVVLTAPVNEENV